MRRSLHVTSVLLTAILLLSSLPSFAANRYRSWYRPSKQVNHFVTAGASIGYSTLLENYHDLKTTGSVGGTVGLGYELRVDKFLLATGVDAQFLTANSSFELPNITHEIYDTQGKLATMNYMFEPIEEAHRFMYLSIPVMVGAYHRGFYFGVGAKVGLPINPITKLSYNYETSGTYGEYIDDFANMSGNGYGPHSGVKQYKNENVPVVRASALLEIGYDVLSPMRRKDDKQRNGLRVAAVCEYGLNNLVSTAEAATSSIMINKQNANDVTVLPYYQTHAISGHHVNNLYAGIKLTWIFDFSKQPCDCEE